ncbi:MAG TPA: hypothetical protein VM261_07765 [Kofleriaceae bacterium]|nr:hypothetical protein [Kofleriaceae bacterium]
MHEAVAALSPGEAMRLVRGDTVDDWCAANGIPCTREIIIAVMRRSNDPEPPPPPPPPNPRRHDEVELVEFVNRAANLPPRLLDVADLCLDGAFAPATAPVAATDGTLAPIEHG